VRFLPPGGIWSGFRRVAEILEQLPKLSEEEKRQLWNILD
jgi:hypothetical protein